MTDAPVLATPPGASGNTVGPDGVELDLLGMTVMAMAPGRVELVLTDAKPTLVVASISSEGGRLIAARVDECPIETLPAATAGFDLHAPVSSFELVCENHGWECLIEMNEARLPGIAAEAHDGRFSFRDPIEGGHDAALAQLASLTIDHLRRGEPDRLYVDGLAIAMTARAFETMRSDTVRSVPTRGTDARILSAVDYAEAHLDRALSVAELASVAAMSPSRFQSSFPTVTGMPVHAYVTERRLDRARRMLTDPTPSGRTRSTAQIAHACGFADASHLGRAFKRRFGTTPGKERKG